MADQTNETKDTDNLSVIEVGDFVSVFFGSMPRELLSIHGKWAWVNPLTDGPHRAQIPYTVPLAELRLVAKSSRDIKLDLDMIAQRFPEIEAYQARRAQ